MRLTILGAGASGGVPAVGVGWGRCDPQNPKNRRKRPSVLIEAAETAILVDTSPDLRDQALNGGFHHLDGVIFTHAHSDHVNGIDDIRGINRAMNAVIDAYGSAETMSNLLDRFGYVFEPLKEPATFFYKPTLVANEVTYNEPFDIGSVTITAFAQDHGFSETTGLRFGDMAYTTDLVDLTEEAFDILEGVKIWIIGVLTDQPHPTHVHVNKALKWIERVKPERAILSHLGHGLDYETLSQRLPEGVYAAYDGMVLTTEKPEE